MLLEQFFFAILSINRVVLFRGRWYPIDVKCRNPTAKCCGYVSATKGRTVLPKVELELLRLKTDFRDGSFYNTLLSAYCHPFPTTVTASEDPFDYSQQPFESWYFVLV